MSKRDTWKGRYNPDLLEGWWCRATPRQIAEGAAWYWKANRTALQMARRTGWPIVNVVAVIAALSPRKTWGANITLAEHILNGGSGGHFPQLVEKAKKLKTARNPLQELSGIKTVNFGHNIMHPDMEDWVTIDTHMLGILGQPVGTHVTDKKYGEAVETVQYVANKYDVLPNVMQAVTWVVYREEKYPGISAND